MHTSRLNNLQLFERYANKIYNEGNLSLDLDQIHLEEASLQWTEYSSPLSGCPKAFPVL